MSGEGLHSVQTGSGRLAGKVAIVTGILVGTWLDTFNSSMSLTLSFQAPLPGSA
jgi:hypothetical protein